MSSWSVTATPFHGDGRELTEEQRDLLFDRIADLTYELEQKHPLFKGWDICVGGGPDPYDEIERLKLRLDTAQRRLVLAGEDES